MLTRVKIFGLMTAALLVLTLVPGAPFGHASLGYARDRQGRPTAAALPEPLNTLNNTEAAEAHFSDFSAPSASSVVQNPLIQPIRRSPAHPQAPTADAENVEFVGHIGGTTKAVAVQGNYAYIGEGGALTILDISNPASPTVVGKTAPLPDIVQDVYVSGDYAYIADSGGGLRVMDVSNPSNPTEMGFCDTPGRAYGVAVAGGYAYVADRYYGLRVVDVSTPSNPTEVGFYDMWGADGVVVAGDYAYVVAGGLRVVDVSTPANPTEVGFCDTPGYELGVAVAGGYAYIADGDSGLRVVDISSPSNPTEVGFYDTPGVAGDVAVSGGYAYIADGYGGLRVVDVSTPSNPTEVGFYDTSGSATDVAVAGGYAYVADYYDGLQVVDVSTPSNSTEVGFYDTPECARGVAVAGGYAYIADGDSGLRVVDVSTPASPTEVGFYDTPGYAEGVAVAGDYVYVADGYSGLRVVDVSTPASPTEVGFYDTPGIANDVAVGGGYAYIADGGLRVVDVSTPSNPREVGFYDTPECARGVAVAGGYAYVANRDAGLRVVDVSMPSNPTEVGFYDTPGWAEGVAIAGGYAYVADGYDGSLWVVDVSDPTNPTEVGFYDTPGCAEGVAVAGGYAYVADWNGGLLILRFTGSGDTTPPAAITDLAAGTGTGAGEVDLTWTAPGDDGNTGTAMTYTVRYADSAIVSVFGWEGATDVDGEPTPQAAGSSESMTVSGLTPGQTYYFAIRTQDEAGNWSGLSNSPSAVASEAPDLGFRPNLNGYQFDNDQFWRTWEMFEQFFGPENVTRDGSRCVAAERFFQNEYRAAANGYSCLGFSLTSLLSYLDWSQPNAGPFAIDHYEQLYQQLESAQLTNPIAYYSGVQTEMQYIQAYQSRTDPCSTDPNKKIESIMQGIQNEEPVVVVLYTFTEHGWHALAPYRIEEVSSTETDIYVYDSEAPGQERAIHFEGSGDDWQWEYTFVGSLSGAGTRTGGCEDIFLYPVETSLEQGEPPVNFCQSQSRTPAANSSQTVAFSERVLAHLPVEGNWVIQDSLGRRLGWVNGEFVSEIPDAYHIPQALGDASLSHRTLYLPEAEYTVEINDSPTEAIEYILFGDGRFIEMSGRLQSVGSSAVLSATSSLDQVTLSGLQNLTWFNLALDNESTTESRLATVAGTPVSGNEALNADFDGAQMVISRTGGDLQYNLWLEESNGQIFMSEPLTMEANETHTLSPTNWTELNSASVILEIDEDSDGTTDETLVLENQVKRVYLPLILRNYTPGSEPTNRPPNTPSNPSPSDGATNQLITVTLSWTGGDPDGDSVTYAVYFEANDSTPDVLICNDVTSTFCDPGTLSHETHHYWQVIARDSHEATTTGPVWDFTTEGPPSATLTLTSPNGGENWHVGTVHDVTWTSTGSIANVRLEYSKDGFISDTHTIADSTPNDGSYSWPVPNDPSTTVRVRVSDASNPSINDTSDADWGVFNNPPHDPSNPSPPDDATNQPITVTLSWTGGDPDGDSVTYDVYFEADDSTPDVLVSDDQSGTFYDPGTLITDTHYYWQIVATDEHGATTTGPVWDFTTHSPDTPSSGVPFGAGFIITDAADGAWSVYAVDVDGDGDMDVLSASENDDKIAWYENDGGSFPAFTSHVITTSANAAKSVYAADMDGDGDVDVLSASSDDDKIAWYENNGGSPPAFTGYIITTTADDARSVHAADVDGDGDMDVLSASYGDNKIAWYENDGASPPAFTSHVITTNADCARSVYAADVDGDGDLDVLSASYDDDKIAWYENDGGSPPAFTSHVITTDANGAWSVYAVDVDGDGDVDVLSTSIWDTKAWYENDGGSPPSFTSHVIAGGDTSVYAVDVDGDGDVDVLSASVWGDKIAWYENDGGSPPAFTSHVITTAANGVWSVYAADVDGDGDLDVLSASGGDDKIAWYPNQTIHRNAAFPVQSHAVITTNTDWAASVYTADVDGDGDLDVLSASEFDDKIAWYENDSGSPPSFTSHVIATDADGAHSVYAADVDSDGDVDVLSASVWDDKITWYENDGGSPPAFTAHVITTSADYAVSVYATDVDSDGDMDVLSASVWDDKIAWYENDGGSPPAFTGHVITTTADGAHSVYAADVDGDGDMDVLSASHNDDKIAWYENDGSSPPSFTSHVITTNANSANSVYATDVDGDGDVDVLSTSSGDDKIAWYENDGGSPPTFTGHIITTNADYAESVYAADVDGDGDVDVLSASANDDKIAWYENDGSSPPSFTSHVITTNANGAVSITAADVDGDGDLDVLSASFNDDKIVWYENRGGQFALITTDTAPGTIIAGQQGDLLRIVAIHRGRSGDTDAELTTFELLFEESAGDPLTTAEANHLIENLHIYRDDGSGSFESGTDTLVATVGTLSLVAGTQTVTFADGDPNVQLAFGAPITYFVVAELTGDAASQTPNQFRVTHVTESSSTAEDRDHDLLLTLEFVPDVASSIVIATPGILLRPVERWPDRPYHRLDDVLSYHPIH